MINLKLPILLLAAICFTACDQRQSKTVNTVILNLRINDYLTACESNGFNGAVLVAKGDNIILNKGYGFANKKKSFANTPKQYLISVP